MKKYLIIFICLYIYINLYSVENNNFINYDAEYFKISKISVLMKYSYNYDIEKTYKLLFWSGFFYSSLNSLNTALISIPIFLEKNPNGDNVVIRFPYFALIFLPSLANTIISPIPFAGPIIVTTYDIISSIAFLISFSQQFRYVIFTPLFISGMLEIGAIILEFLSLKYYNSRNKERKFSLTVFPNMMEYNNFELILCARIKF
jgi:hypothetical protein